MQPLQKSRLGRGLASLIGDSGAPKAESKLPPEGEQRMLPVDLVRAGRFNPRKDFREDDLAELAESIRQKGLVQPIVVRPDPASGGYEIVAGERRWRAAQRAQLHQVPAIIRDLSDQDALEIAIIENVQRADLNAVEEAGGYRELMERFGYTQDQLAEVIGKSRSHLANTLRLLKLPAGVLELLKQGSLSAGHARALVGREDAEALALHIVKEGLTVREVEALVQADVAAAVAAANSNSGRQPREKDADTRAFEKEMTDTLGLKVEVKRSSGESGVLTIKYGNFDQLDYIRQRLTLTGGG
jgi:ParB family chromosome partitioning protein